MIGTCIFYGFQHFQNFGKLNQGKAKAGKAGVPYHTR
jgi:hypothetical protein